MRTLNQIIEETEALLEGSGDSVAEILDAQGWEGFAKTLLDEVDREFRWVFKDEGYKLQDTFISDRKKPVVSAYFDLKEVDGADEWWWSVGVHNDRSLVLKTVDAQGEMQHAWVSTGYPIKNFVRRLNGLLNDSIDINREQRERSEEEDGGAWDY